MLLDTRDKEPELGMRAFRRGLRALERRIARALEDQTSCCGVSAAQCHLLLEMAEAGAGSIGFFAERLGLDLSTLSRTVESLVQAGFALRAADPADRRRQLVSLSDAGKERAEAIGASCDAYYAEVLAALPPGMRAAALAAVPLLAEAMDGSGQGSARKDSACCLPE